MRINSYMKIYYVTKIYTLAPAYEKGGHGNNNRGCGSREGKLYNSFEMCFLQSKFLNLIYLVF